jgi:acyl transferase domain-containing protein
LTIPATPLAIVGIGCLFPKANDVGAYWANLKNGIDCITEVPATHWNPADYFDADPKKPDHTYARRGGFLDPQPFPPGEYGIAPNDLEATDTSQLLGLVAARMALADAGINCGLRNAECGMKDKDSGSCNPKSEVRNPKSRVSVILGVTGTLELVVPLGARLGHPHWKKAMREAGVPEAQIEDAAKRIGASYVPWQEQSFPGLLGNVVAGRIANRLDLHGTNCVVDAACASSLSALHLASMELATGRTDVVVTGGVDTFNDIFMYMCFSKTPALSPTGDSRPFSANADGTILGEGLGIVVLKRLADAERDGDRIYAVVKGIGTSSDGKGNAIYAPSADGQKRCLLEAYSQAGVTPDTIELVEAHGTGTKVGDATEISALANVFSQSAIHNSQSAIEHPWCALGSVKSQIGHTKAAAGAAGLVKAALALYHKVLPATIKVDKPAEALADTPFYVNTVKRPWLASDHPRRAAVSAFGFGGSNFHCVLEEHQRNKAAIDWDGDVQIVALSDKTRDGLRKRIGELNTSSWASFCKEAAETRAEFRADARFRMLFIATVDSKLTDLRANALLLLDQHGNDSFAATPDGIYYGHGKPAGKLGVLFPGQGSQYVGMLRDLACQFPQMQQVLDEANQVYFSRSHAESESRTRLSDQIYPPPAFTSDTRSAQEISLRATHVAQPAIGAVSLGALRVLDAFGVRPEAAAGHSFGELTALCAAGCFDAASLHRLSRLRGQLMAEVREGDAGAMLAVHADANQIESAIRDEQLDLIIANRNSPLQSVLSGATTEIERAAKVLSGRQLRTTRLPVAAAFHSPLVAGAETPFRAALESIRFQAAQLPVFANTSACEYPDDPSQIRGLLAGQLARPVDFVKEIGTMVKHGVRTFVEVGPGNTLTRLVEAILRVQEPGHNADAFAIDASAGKRSGIVDLAHALARIAARGHEVTLTAWEANPPHPAPRIHSDKPGLIVPISGANYVKPKNQKSEVRSQSEFKPTPPVPTMKPATAATAVPTKSISNVPSRIASVAESIKLPSSGLSQVLQVTQEGLIAFQKLQEQTAQLHRQFLQGQEAAQTALARLIEQQQQLMLGTSNTEIRSQKAEVRSQQPEVSSQKSEIVHEPISREAKSPNPVSSEAKSSEPSAATQQTLLAVIAEKTGYPAEMLNLDMGLDADLGIDSIKRVEILSALQERLPNAPVVKPEHLGTLNTLRQIVEFLSNGHQPSAVSSQHPVEVAQNSIFDNPQSAIRNPQFQETLLAVIAEKTGYPAEMLNLDMGLDADLGIDSIKRVEILSALQERLPSAPVVKPEHLGTLNTLRQIVEFLSGGDPVSREAETVSREAKSSEPSAERSAFKVTRQTLRSAPLPFELDRPAVAVAPGSTFYLVSEREALADQLQHQLESRGFRIRRFAWNAAVEKSTDNFGGLLLLPSRTGLTDEHLLHAFRWTRACGAALAKSATLFATISRIDGTYGVDGWPDSASPLAGGFAGLSKTAHHEWPNVACKAIDIAPENTNALAIIDELFRRGPTEVGIVGEQLHRLELIASASPKIDTALIDSSDVIVITGGARGVTAEAALAIAETYQCKLVLLGRSPPPADEPDWLKGLSDESTIKRELGARLNGQITPRELNRRYQEVAAQREVRTNLQRMQAAGSVAEYRSVDIRDADAVDAVIADIRSQLGPITGIVHGAGVIEDRRIEDKTDEQFQRVYGTKVEGLRNLLAATADDPLKVIALFSSSTGRFGRVGQVDYAVANEVLNKVARQQALRRPNCRVASINWGPWEGGMVTPGLRKIFEQEGVGLIPLRDGAEFLLSELSATDAPVEVVAGVWQTTPSNPPVATNFATAVERSVSVAKWPVLADHVLDGKAVLPLALHLEWLAHAAMHGNPGLAFAGFDEVRVLSGLKLATDETSTLSCRAARAEKRDGTYRVAVELVSTSSGRTVIHSRAVCILGQTQSGQRPSLPRATGRKANAANCYAKTLFHGPAWHGLVDGLTIGRNGFEAQARNAPPPSEWQEMPLRPHWILDPLIVDTAFQGMIVWGVEQFGMPNLPCGIASYRQFARAFPATGCLIVARIAEPTSALIRADIEFCSADGDLVARIEGAEFVADTKLVQAFRHERQPATTA